MRASKDRVVIEDSEISSSHNQFIIVRSAACTIASSPVPYVTAYSWVVPASTPIMCCALALHRPVCQSEIITKCWFLKIGAEGDEGAVITGRLLLLLARALSALIVQFSVPAPHAYHCSTIAQM